MTPEDKKVLERQYEEMFATMATPGWKLIMEDWERLRVNYSNVRHCTNLDMTKGRLDILDLIANWPNAVRLAHESLNSVEVEEEIAQQTPFRDQQGVAEIVDDPRI